MSKQLISSKKTLIPKTATRVAAKAAAKKPRPAVKAKPSEAKPDAQPKSRFRQAYDRRSAEILSVAPEAVLVVNLDLTTAVTSTLAVVENLRAFVGELSAEITHFDPSSLDDLEDYTLSTGYSHALYMSAVTPGEDLTPVGAEAVALRDLLFADAEVLGRHGLLDANRLRDLKGTTGYRNVAFDLICLAAMFRDAWPTLEGKTATDTASLDRAEALADHLITAVGTREQSAAQVAEAAQMRARAFTLFANAYDQLRRAITFLRWDQGDADTIAPSLYAGRNNGNHRPAKTAASGATDTPPVTPAPASISAAPANSATARIPVGFPGASPFASS